MIVVVWIFSSSPTAKSSDVDKATNAVITISPRSTSASALGPWISALDDVFYIFSY